MPHGGIPTSGGGGSLAGIGDILGTGIGAAAGGFFRDQDRNLAAKNQFRQGVAENQFGDPNRALTDALQRNVRGNFLQNLSKMDPNKFGKGGTFDAFFKSISSGVNPDLIRENLNIGGVPGLTVDGKLIGIDPNDLFKPKGSSIWKNILKGAATGAAGFFGGPAAGALVGGALFKR